MPFYLVANKKLNDDDVADLTRAIMIARRELINEFPLLSQISAPSTDKDAFIPIHPGAAAYYGDTQQSFFDKYSNQLYYGPMAIGVLVSGLATAWKFLGFGGSGQGGALSTRYTRWGGVFAREVRGRAGRNRKRYRQHNQGRTGEARGR